MKIALACGNCLLVLGLASGVGAPQGLGAADRDQDVRTRIGSTTQERLTRPAWATSTTQSAAPETSSTGLVWSYSDAGEGWVAECVSLGENGTQAFAHCWLNNTVALLFSSFDQHPPVPIWSLSTDPANPSDADSATEADVHASITATQTAVHTERIVEIRKWSSGSSVPDWIYTHPQLVPGAGPVGVPRDGRFVLAMIPEPGPLKHYLVLIFNAESGALLRSFEVPGPGVQGGGLYGFDLAEDGHLALFTLLTTAYVLDLDTGRILFEHRRAEAFSSKGIGISADGSVFALAGLFGDGTFQVYERVAPTTWQLSYVHHLNVNSNPGCLEVSEDGSTIAAAYGFQYPSTLVHVLAIDVATNTRTMHDVHSSYGQFQNHPMDLEITADGRRFVVGEMGDEPGVVPELRVYERDRDAPVYTYDLPGSIFDVDISAEGEWVLAGSKAVHGNQMGRGGRIDLFRMAGADLDVVGKPSIGSDIDFVVHGAPGKQAMLLLARRSLPVPLSIGGIGVLHLDRRDLVRLPLGVIPASGQASLTWSIPGVPGLVGSSLFAQGLTLPPVHLGTTWRKVTLLP